MEERHVGVIEGNTTLGHHLTTKSIIGMERVEESEEGELIGAGLGSLIGGRDALDPAMGIVDMAIKVKVRLSGPVADAEKLHPGLVPEACIEYHVLPLDSLPKGPNRTSLMLRDILVVQVVRGSHDNPHHIALGPGPLLKLSSIGRRHRVN